MVEPDEGQPDGLRHGDRAIAERLFISPATVARHVANLDAKLGAGLRVEAVAVAHRRGLG